MRRLLHLLLLLIPLLVVPALAQHGAAPAATRAAPGAAQLDFLVGEWALELSPKASSLGALIHGAPKLMGSWKVWRNWDGRGIDDELRVFDAAGTLLSLTHSLRVYDPAGKRWLVHTLDVPRARLTSSSGVFENGELRLQSLPGSLGLDGKPQLTRTRIDEIAADRFRLRQDRSADNGASWEEGVLTIMAKRVSRKASR